MSRKDLPLLYGAAFGFNTDRRIKPVHFATGFFVSLLEKKYEQRTLNKTVAFSEGKELEGDYALPTLHEQLLSEGRISPLINLPDLHFLRKQLRCLANNDDAVYVAYGRKASFGCNYSTASSDVLTHLKDNDGFAGYFVFSVLEKTPEGKTVIEFARRGLDRRDITWRSILAPLLEDDALDEDSGSRYESKILAPLDNKRLRSVAQKMRVQTRALSVLCANAEILAASETKLRVLVIGLCLWLFRYLANEGISKPNVNGVILVDMLGDSSSKMRSQSRWSYSRMREELVASFSRFEQEGRYAGCKEAWKYVKSELGGRPKFEEFYRELALRSGLAQPRSSRIAAKHFELQPETLRVAVMSVISTEGGMVPLTEVLDSLFDTWGLCFGGRQNDGAVLSELGYSGLDQDQDLTPNTDALVALLSDLGLATRFSDGVVMCHAKETI